MEASWAKFLTKSVDWFVLCIMPPAKAAVANSGRSLVICIGFLIVPRKLVKQAFYYKIYGNPQVIHYI